MPPKRSKTADHGSEDELHEDQTVKEILALAKSDCPYVALTSLFEYNSSSEYKPSAAEQRNYQMRISALEMLKPRLKELTISFGDGKSGIKQLSGTNLRHYSSSESEITSKSIFI
ncbi:hypothetical protein BV898_07668 [Hypsibius exemplaris]|uniref:Uncharacterized protein n=1 Tax=Hypsibius exemplaris TaxID=2072580 RepID=A0A1W0WSU1_HYPEX|nr:hypothetical protein BV898_07668 [Hypsibius exemplaris]